MRYIRDYLQVCHVLKTCNLSTCRPESCHSILTGDNLGIANWRNSTSWLTRMEVPPALAAVTTAVPYIYNIYNGLQALFGGGSQLTKLHPQGTPCEGPGEAPTLALYTGLWGWLYNNNVIASYQIAAEVHRNAAEVYKEELRIAAEELRIAAEVRKEELRARNLTVVCMSVVMVVLSYCHLQAARKGSTT